MSTILPVLVGGEALFDFIATEIGCGLGNSRTFQKRVGGSPFNIAVGVRRLAVPVSFIGKIGADRFGDALVAFLKAESIDVTHVVREPGTKTILAFVPVDQQGKPEFHFYLDHAADNAIRSDELTNWPTAKAMLFMGQDTRYFGHLPHNKKAAYVPA